MQILFLRFLRWKTSFFAEESREIIDLPNNSRMFLYNVNGEDLIILESFESKARIVVFRIETTKGFVTKLQSMFLKKNHVEHFLIDRKLYLVACTTEMFCAVYKWTNLQFRRHRKLSSQIFENVKEIRSKHDLVIVEDSANNLLFHVREDDVVSSTPSLIIPKNTSDYLIYKDKMDRIYFVDANFTEDKLLMNFHEIELANLFESREAIPDNPVECIAELKENLKMRFSNVGKSRTLVSCSNDFFKVVKLK